MCVLSSNDGGTHAGELDTNPGIFDKVASVLRVGAGTLVSPC